MKTKARKVKTSGLSKKQIYLIALGAIIIVIMVGSAIDVYKGKDEGLYEYKGIKFRKAEGNWFAYLSDGRKVVIMSDPAELANITLSNVDISQFNLLSKVYISYNPKERVRNALVEFYREIPLNTLKVPACTVENELCTELPIKTCNDTTRDIGVVVFREANETIVTLENNCLTIQGKDLVKVVDKLILEQL